MEIIAIELALALLILVAQIAEFALGELRRAMRAPCETCPHRPAEARADAFRPAADIA